MMELSGIAVKGLGRLAVFMGIGTSLNWIDHMIQKYLLDIEPVPTGIFPMVIILGGVLLWTLGDLLDRREG